MRRLIALIFVTALMVTLTAMPALAAPQGDRSLPEGS